MRFLAQLSLKEFVEQIILHFSFPNSRFYCFIVYKKHVECCANLKHVSEMHG